MNNLAEISQAAVRYLAAQVIEIFTAMVAYDANPEHLVAAARELTERYRREYLEILKVEHIESWQQENEAAPEADGA